MKTISIYSPEGRAAEIRNPATLAPLPALSGARLAVLDNGKAGARHLLTRMAEALAQRTGSQFVGAWRKGSAATPCEPELVERLASEAQIVLTGTAD
jgi:hypothetical protein